MPDRTRFHRPFRTRSEAESALISAAIDDRFLQTPSQANGKTNASMSSNGNFVSSQGRFAFALPFAFPRLFSLDGLAVLMLALSCLLAGASPTPALATCSPPLQETMEKTTAQEASWGENLAWQDDRFSVQLGFNGNMRLGRWLPILIRTHAVKAPDHFKLTTVDGDDVGITYQGRLNVDPDRNDLAQGWFRLGRKVKSVELALYQGTVDTEPIAQLSLSIRDTLIAKSTQPLAIAMTSSDQVDAGYQMTAKGKAGDKNQINVAIRSADQLPSDWMAMDSVGSMLLLGSDPATRDLTTTQVEAIQRWVENGGRLIISVPAEANSLIGTGGKLQPFVPGVFQGPASFSNSSSLESFANSRNQLIATGGVPIGVAKIELANSLRAVVSTEGIPLIVRQAWGRGEIVFVAFDLDDPQLKSWSSYKTLISLLPASELKPTSKPNSGTAVGSRAIAHYGYTDLLGQLRIPLDRFSEVGFVPFTVVAILITIYILMIGPLDYFVLRKLLGRMELTWVTFPFYSLLFCALAYFVADWARPTEVQINQLEIIDIDLATGKTQGRIWANLYSPHGKTTDVALSQQHGLGFPIQSESVSWSGLPGSGLGGMLNRPSPSGPTQAYIQQIEMTGGHVNSSMSDVPAQVSSSRSFIGQWWSDQAVEMRNLPRFDRKTNAISGTIKNPFDFELKNCRLLYQEWAYVLDSPLPPGEVFAIGIDAPERDLSDLLKRRATRANDKKNYSVGKEWDPADKRMSRIADMLMFHKAAGGKTYTRLTHDYFPSVDLSDHLQLGRAILVAEVSRPGGQLELNGGKVSSQADQTTTFIRIIIPIAR